VTGGDILVLKGHEIEELLAGREAEIVGVVSRAYVAHGEGKSSLPHSTFLRFPGDDVNRIIALPAFLGDGFGVAGMKWISSFPGNVRRDMARASAVMVLNDCDTGRPYAFLEGSLISARRTAASAALGARELLEGKTPERVGLIGTGLINFEIARFVRALTGAGRFLLHDLDAERAERFLGRLTEAFGVEAEVAGGLDEVLAACPLTAFATTAVRPYVEDLSTCAPRSVILHVSLRDLAPEVVLGCDNVVDDADHVCRAGTSLHLAEQATGHRDFIRCTLADVLSGRAPARVAGDAVTVFSSFGLGVLDVALGTFVVDAARSAGAGVSIDSFFPVTGEVFS
jgi:ornithine cyclodeaminase